MGISTHGFLNKEVTATDIYNVVVAKFDKEAKFDIKADGRDMTERGNIYFKYNEENRQLFYCITEDKEDGTEFENRSPHVCLILGCWGSSVKILTEVIKEFGGYIDDNDCDEFDAYYIPKDSSLNYDDFVKERNKIVELLDECLNYSIKVQVANQIFKHKEKLKEVIKGK